MFCCALTCVPSRLPPSSSSSWRTPSPHLSSLPPPSESETHVAQSEIPVRPRPNSQLPWEICGNNRNPSIRLRKSSTLESGRDAPPYFSCGLEPRWKLKTNPGGLKPASKFQIWTRPFLRIQVEPNLSWPKHRPDPGEAEVFSTTPLAPNLPGTWGAGGS